MVSNHAIGGDGMAGFDARPYALVARRAVPGARLLRAWPLEGGASAVVTALEVLAGTPVPAPHPVFVNLSDEVLGQPYLVVEHIEGAVDGAPDEPMWVAGQLASQLALIHRVDVAGLEWLPNQEELVAREHGLLHGDFWSGNVLWRNGRVVGVLDWEDAALGDPAADLANGRLEGPVGTWL